LLYNTLSFFFFLDLTFRRVSGVSKGHRSIFYGPAYQTTQLHLPEERPPLSHRCENLLNLTPRHSFCSKSSWLGTPSNYLGVLLLCLVPAPTCLLTLVRCQT
jgi:hypothetical protein